MIGYYIHHHGLGHLRRAQAIAAVLPAGGVTGLSSLPRPADWAGPWTQLEPDNSSDSPRDVDANGHLHWVPARDPGLRARMAQLSAWIQETDPAVLVADVSVEAALLARLHGVPVVTVALPGVRLDRAHTLGFGVSDAVIAAWPAAAERMLHAGAEVLERLQPVGAISRLPVQSGRLPGRIARVLVLGGAGGGGMDDAALADARAQTPGVQWIPLGTRPGNRSANPLPHLLAADLVLTHAGQGALADVAAAGIPAVIVPQERPHREQATTGQALAAMDLPVIVSQGFARRDWAAVLESAAKLDGRKWAAWNDGAGAARAARIIAGVAGIRTLPAPPAASETGTRLGADA
ncbi:glycosyltransferase [Arthrobacter sp. 3Tela_A]|uniref:glycosyltransferase n=1 Tax=Arthrobacter sp. 3Tela_A TaxID=3093743 RepID=UPI003BB5FFCC